MCFSEILRLLLDCLFKNLLKYSINLNISNVTDKCLVELTENYIIIKIEVKKI